MPTETTARVVRRPRVTSRTVTADICVVGAGIAGISAALEAARLGRRVVIVDAAPALGGQAIGSIIGTIIGLYTHGPEPYQITHGIADDLIADLTAEGSLNRRISMTGTITFQYDEVRLARWIEKQVEAAGIQVLVGAVMTGVIFEGRRLQAIELATRFGAVRVEAHGFVDASGDASLTYEAGLEVREPDAPVYGSLNFLIEGYDTEAVKNLVIADVHARLAERGAAYGLVRHDGFLMHFPGKNIMLANVTHFETPLDPLGSARMVFEGRRQADNVIRFLRAEFPDIFRNAQVRTYGNPGLRQTRWIVGRKQLTLDEIRSGARPADAAARCAWWVELHNAPDLVHWEKFAPDHVYYIPLSCMVPRDADNIVAAGRCVDADVSALSAIRVMGPCIAMGAAAAHALDLAGTGAVHAIDYAALQPRLADNLDDVRRLFENRPLFVAFEFFVVDLARSLRCLCALLEDRNQRGVAVLARELERREPVLVARVGLRARLQQQLDHRRVAEVHVRRPQQRRHALLVHDVHVGAARDQHARHLDLVVEDASAEHRDAVAIGEVDRRAEIEQRGRRPRRRRT